MSTIYSVTQLNNEIKELLDTVPGYRNLLVQGEISNYKAHSSGHHYMSLKDEGASINAVMFRSDAMRLKFRLENGMKVIVRARVSSFPRTGQVQLYISEVIPDGAGALNLAFEQLKKKLQAEGLFDPMYKKPIPRMPRKIALVTSPTGAAVRDMIRILGRRWPLAVVTLYPAQVQGQGAAESIARAIGLANAIGEADVILCGRGGGSMEDLWAFNEEAVARAIFASEIPVISAVGHEPDVTIADFVADLRAATPSNAAELAVPDQKDVAGRLNQLSARMDQAMTRRLGELSSKLEHLSGSRALQNPMNYIEDRRVLLDYQRTRLAHGLSGALNRERQRFARLAASLDAMSPLKVLARGYAIPRREDGTVVRSKTDVVAGDTLHLRVADGEIPCVVKEH